MSAKTEIFDLPSGAKIEFRALTLKEENILASARGRKMESALDRVLSSCVIGIHDKGPYAEIGENPNWDKMLQGDRFVAMIRLRCISYRDGEEYSFMSQCPECGKRGEQSVNLTEELTVRDLSDEVKATMADETPFKVEIAGSNVTYSLSYGAHAKAFERLREQNPKRPMAAALRSRILEVDGVENRDIMNWLDGEKKGFTGLTSDEAEDLRDAFDIADCGVDTEVELECPKCWAAFVINLPFDDGFFLPQRGRKKRKSKRRHSADS